MSTVLKQSGFAATLLGVALPAAGHHSRNIYDQDRRITIEGVVTEFEWANPHVYLYVQAQGGGSGPVVWAIEHGSTTAMKKRGWSPDTFVPGDRVIVEANPGRDPDRPMALIHSVRKDGATWFGRGTIEGGITAAEGSAAAEGLTGTWVVQQTELVDLFSDPSGWPLTAPGRRGIETYDDLTMNPQIHCMPRTAPWFMIFPSVQRIEVGEASISIRSEYDTIERTIHLDATTHDGAAPSYQGHSIGWWEGDALVVDTTLFDDHRSGHARGVPSGAQKHLVERFRLDPGRTSLTYRFELEDPEHLAEPVTGEVQSAYRPDVEFAPVQCDLANARRFVGD